MMRRPRPQRLLWVLDAIALVHPDTCLVTFPTADLDKEMRHF